MTLQRLLLATNTGVIDARASYYFTVRESGTGRLDNASWTSISL